MTFKRKSTFNQAYEYALSVVPFRTFCAFFKAYKYQINFDKIPVNI